MVDQDLGTITMAQADRDAASSPVGRWSLETGGGSQKVPEDWLRYWPSRAIAKPNRKAPTAWINAAGYCVSPEVKEIIEELAPGVHQFVPLVLEAGPKKARKKYPYFSLHVADRADEVDLDKCIVNRRVSKSGGEYWTKRFSDPIALPETSIRGKHIWWNRCCHILLISGELHDRMVGAGCSSGLTFQKQIVV